MELYISNQGDVCIYNWVEWLRENVKPQALSPTYRSMLVFMHSTSKHVVFVESEKGTGEKPKAHGVPEPLPVKEFAEGAGKNAFIRPVGCVQTDTLCNM